MGNSEEYHKTAKEAACETVRILYESTKQLAAINNASLDTHEQIRKNCETLLGFYLNGML